MRTLKTIFSYDSYRQYLKDYYFLQKEISPSYTYAKFANDANLNSANYLKLVMDGTRNLTVTNIQQFGKALSLDFSELVFFEALVLREQACIEDEAKYYSKRVSELRKNKQLKAAKIGDHSFVSNWYVPAILVSLQGQPTSINLGSIAEQIGITKESLAQSLELLMKRQVVQIQNEKYFLEPRHLTYHDPKLSNLYQKKYLKAQLDRSLTAFNKQYERGAKFYSHTFTLPADDLSTYQSQINNFIESLVMKADQGAPEKVAQINLQFFPLAN